MSTLFNQILAGFEEFATITNNNNLKEKIEKYKNKNIFINEASYGGAYDIEDDMYFTNDELLDNIPYTYEQMEQELKSATNDWTKDNFEGWVDYEDEFESAMQILSHHYENVDNLGHTHRRYGFFATRPSLFEDTVKQNGKWVNKGKEGTHGKFATKKAADAQRRAIWVNWNK